MARGGFERPPRWAQVLLAAGVLALVAGFGYGTTRKPHDPVSNAELARMDAAASAAAASDAAVAAAAKRVKIAAGADGVTTVLVIGDSYTVGAGTANPATEGFVPVLAHHFGWSTRVVSVSGGGYVQVGRDKNGPYGKALAAVAPKSIAPDAVLVEGGYNDVRNAPGTVGTAAANLFAQIRTQWPNVPLVVVGVQWPNSPRPRNVVDVTAAVQRATQGPSHLLYVDLSKLTYPLSPDGIHPTAAGHQAIASTIAAAISAQ